MREIRGSDISMIFQEPMTSLNPVFTVGAQVMEAIRLHQDVSKSEADKVVQASRTDSVSSGTDLDSCFAGNWINATGFIKRLLPP